MRTSGARIRELVILILCILGLADTLFLHVQEGRGTIGEFCESISGEFGANCEKVLTSSYASIGGMGLSVLGILYYLSLTWLAFWRRLSDGSGSRIAQLLITLFSGAGVLVSGYLVYLQYAVIKAWCPFCLISAGDTALIFLLSLFGYASAPPPAEGFDPVSADPAGERPSAALAIVTALSLFLASGLVVTLSRDTVKRSADTLEKMSRFIPRRVTPPGGLSYGSDSATVVVQAFLDYTCQYCRSFEREAFPKIKSGYVDSGRVKWVSKILPHSDQGAPLLFGLGGVCGRSTPAAAVVERALFDYPIPSPKTGLDALMDALAVGGVPAESKASVAICVQRHPDEMRQIVITEVHQAMSYGLKGPPAFVVDGIAFQGSMDYQTMSDLLELFLKQHGG